MTELQGHSSGPTAEKHGDNPVISGLSTPHPYALLKGIVSRWQECGRLDVVVLRAVCQLSLEQPDKAGSGYTSQEIVGAVGRLLERPWSKETDPDQCSRDVRTYWKKLLEFWRTKEEGVGQRLCDEGVMVVPQLLKSEGGGATHQSRYWIGWVAPEDVRPQASAVNERQATGTPESGLKYICEDLQDPGFFARIFAKGYPLAGWRRRLLLSVALAALLFLYVLIVTGIFSVAWLPAMGARELFKIITGLLVAISVVWVTIGPLVSVSAAKIVIAPWWMQSFDDDRLLEYRGQPRFPEKSIKAVRYSATCPACGGSVAAKSGRLAFWGRIVGRCEQAPQEHVYSFDHVTRSGRPLR